MREKLKPYSDKALSLQPGTYRHYKGNLYTFVKIARHSETLEELVVYEDANGQCWVRPLPMFCEKVEIEGKTLPRFQPI